DGVRLRPTRLEGPVPVVVSLPTDRAEARSLARAVLDRHGPETPWAHQAVLVRTNAQGVLIEEAFQAVRIPYRLRGRLPFTELPEVRDALHQLRRHRAGFREGLAVLETSVLDGDGSGDEAGMAGASDAEAARMANLAELLRLAGDYTDSVQAPTADGFVQWLAATVRSEEAAVGSDAVEIATFHAAKGLEWPVVHVAGLEVGLVPITYARTAEAKAEERRLFYVALTRAEREVRLYWAQERTFGTRASPRSRSPYVGEIEPVLTALAAGANPADWRAHLPNVRAALGGRGSGPGTKAADRLDDPADVDLFDALRQWRLARSRAAAVPAYVIFSDATLAELATRRPSSRTSLLAVPGIGPTKAGRFGDDVLALIARHPR
ncbi:MAG: 3'-5' exonuclease, partial [Acidimicrobiales bacterium]